MPTTFAELKRRRVVRTCVFYALIASGVVAFASDAFPALDLPDWTVRVTVIVALLGLPVAAVLAWFFDIRPASVAPDVPVAVASSDPSSIAVLPFADLSAGKDQEYFSDGLTEELLNLLSKVNGLRVVARTSSFAFKGKNDDISRIGSQLRVAHILEGSVRTSGDQLRVTAQLIDVRTGYHMWSQTYDRELRDVFKLQDEISAAIVKTLSPRLLPKAQRLTTATSSIDAYQHYLRGRFHWHQKAQPALHRALEFFSAAIREDAAYAPAYAGLADTWLSLVDTDPARTDESERLDRAEAAAFKALELDPALAEGHTSLGHVYIHRWKWRESEHYLRRACELNPGYAVGHQYLAIMLTLTGNFDEGIAAIRRAQQLDPLALAIHGTAGYLLYEARRYREAEQQLRDVLQLDATREGPHMRLGMVLMMQSRYDEALQHLNEAMRLRGVSPTALPMIALTQLKAGRTDEARATTARVEQEFDHGRVSRFYTAALLAELGEHERALAILEEMADSQHSALVDLAVEPILDPLRGQPRFQALLQRMGLAALGARGASASA